MIKQLAKRGFVSKVYSWGVNFNNLGYDLKEGEYPYLPEPLKFNAPIDVKKSVCSYSESLLLTKEGKIYSWGHFSVIDSNSTFPTLVESTKDINFRDVDISKTHFIGITEQGEVYEESAESIEKIELPGQVKFVAAGNHASFAVLTGENGKDKIYAWSAEGPENGAIFCAEHNLPRVVSELLPVNYWLDQLQTNVKKIKVVESAVVVLLENGELLTWGNNVSGNLGVHRSELALLENEVYQPTRINQSSGIKERVVDFELSDNILAVLTENSKAYFCGLENIFTLRSIPFFPDQKIVKVGALHNKFYLFSSNGKVYSNKPFEEQQFIKYYGDFNLYEIENKYFDGAEIEHIAGKYDNALAVCK
jgi:alpha-tubulin suppressor-like RCC1 family protein